MRDDAEARKVIVRSPKPVTHMKHTIPEGYHSVTPSIIVNHGNDAIDFYTRAFNAEEQMRLPMPDGRIAHAEIKIGDSLVMLSDEFPDWDSLSPKTLGGSASRLLIYVPDVDAAFKQAIDAGGREIMPVSNQFWGDRMGSLEDPFGHRWHLASHVEDVPEDEMAKRMEAFTKNPEAS